ncbi:MAG: extracellular solute-binding protein [Chloroflexota bacterium]
MKRITTVVLLLALLLSSVMLVNAQDDSEDTECAESTGVALTLAGWSSSESEDVALITQLETFTCETGIDVTFAPSTDHRVTMQSAFATEDYPNVFYIDSSYLPDWVEAGVVATGEDDIENIEGFYESLIDIFTYEGVLYCPPKDFSTMALQYNKDLFDAAGLEYPTAEWTWEDLRAAAEALTNEEEGVIGLVTPPNLERWLPFLYQNGGALFDDFGVFVLDSDEALEALDYYISFAQDGIGGPPDAVDAGWGGEAFGTGRAAMAMEGNWTINFLLENYPELNWGVAEMPAGPADEATMAFTVCYGVGETNEYPEESWQLVNFLTGVDGQDRFAEVTFGPMPSRPAAADTYLETWAERTEGTEINHEEFDAFLIGADYAYPWVLPVGWNTFTDAFNGALQEAFDGQLTAEDMLTTVVEVAEELQAE